MCLVGVCVGAVRTMGECERGAELQRSMCVESVPRPAARVQLEAPRDSVHQLITDASQQHIALSEAAVSALKAVFQMMTHWRLIGLDCEVILK